VRGKLRILRDEDTGPILDAVKRARDEVANWPEWKRGEPAPTARIVRMQFGRTWHSVLADKDVTIITDCGIEMSRGAWWQTEDESVVADCRKCERAIARRARRAGKAGNP